MAMNALVEIVEPNGVMIRMTVQMPYQQWVALRKQLPNEWPSWEFGALIRNALDETIEHVSRAQEVKS